MKTAAHRDPLRHTAALNGRRPPDNLGVPGHLGKRTARRTGKGEGRHGPGSSAKGLSSPIKRRPIKKRRTRTTWTKIQIEQLAKTVKNPHPFPGARQTTTREEALRSPLPDLPEEQANPSWSASDPPPNVWRVFVALQVRRPQKLARSSMRCSTTHCPKSVFDGLDLP